MKSWLCSRPILERCPVWLPIVVGMAVISAVNSNSLQQHVCTSAECLRTAKEVLGKMKTDIEPCEDFYEFACGNFIKKTQIPEERSFVNFYSLLEDKLLNQLNNTLTEETPKTEPKHLRLPNDLFKACINTTLIEYLGTQPLKQISDYLGGWPVVVGSSWNHDNSWSWQNLSEKFRRIGFNPNPFIVLSVVVDQKNNTRHIINLDQPSFGSSRYLLVENFSSTFFWDLCSYMTDIAVLLGATKETAKKELFDTLLYQMDLAKITRSRQKRSNFKALYNPHSIKQLQQTYPYLQWLDYINAHLPPGITVTEDEVVNLSVPSYFENLGKLLQNNPKRVIANYMMWQFHASSVDFLPEQFRLRKLQYLIAVAGKQVKQTRWRQCVNVVIDSLPISVGSLHVRKHFKHGSKAIVMEMLENIKDAYGRMFDKAAWMDAKAKTEAKRKLHTMEHIIGYIDEILDNDKLEEYYRKLEINPENYFQSYLNTQLFNMEKRLSRFRLPAHKTDWTRYTRIAIVNAVYFRDKNIIELPAGILQDLFSNSGRPQYMNYGALGYVIGHEITHGFDRGGSQFDADGKVYNWWDAGTEKQFLNKSYCLLQQYENYTLTYFGQNLTSSSTSSEIIADNGGLKAAYLAYKTWVAKNGTSTEPKLPGLKYTPQQMFWISYAQSFCTKYRLEYLFKLIDGSYPPNDYRVVGTLKNIKDFADDFRCPANSSMNPVRKCEIW